MALKNTTESYGLIHRSLHWTIALLIICLLIVGLIMGDLENPLRGQVYGIHKATGILVLALVTLRLSWRFYSVVPGYPATMDKFQKFAAHAVHFFLYLAMFGMPLSGWGMSSAAGYPVSFFGLFELPPLVEKSKELGKIFHEVHEYLGFALIGAIAIHIGAALLHHFYYKDTILKRMLKG